LPAARCGTYVHATNHCVHDYYNACMVGSRCMVSSVAVLQCSISGPAGLAIGNCDKHCQPRLSVQPTRASFWPVQPRFLTTAVAATTLHHPNSAVLILCYARYLAVELAAIRIGAPEREQCRPYLATASDRRPHTRSHDSQPRVRRVSPSFASSRSRLRGTSYRGSHAAHALILAWQSGKSCDFSSHIRSQSGV